MASLPTPGRAQPLRTLDSGSLPKGGTVTVTLPLAITTPRNFLRVIMDCESRNFIIIVIMCLMPACANDHMLRTSR